MKEGPKMEMMYFQDFTYQEVERTKKFLRDQWLGEILEIYKVRLIDRICGRSHFAGLVKENILM